VDAMKGGCGQHGSIEDMMPAAAPLHSESPSRHHPIYLSSSAPSQTSPPWQSAVTVGLLGVEPEVVVDGFDQIQSGAEVAFGSLNGGMAKQELDLLEVAAGGPAQFRAGSA
jgi:hypothetical protein